MKIIFLKNNESIYFETSTNKMVGCTDKQILKYFKGVYSNKERFKAHFMDERLTKIQGLKERDAETFEIAVNFFNKLINDFEKTTPFTLIEAFKLTERVFQALVFSSINITEMIQELGATRYKTDGINVKHRKYNDDGEFVGHEDYYNIYEIHEVNGRKLGINDYLYVVKCWCTSTNKEHWLWIDEAHKEDPLTAIASTFMVHENVIPHIKALKRQGDILLVEMDKEVEPEGNIVSLTKEQYFGLLVAQS